MAHILSDEPERALLPHAEGRTSRRIENAFAMKPPRGEARAASCSASTSSSVAYLSCYYSCTSYHHEVVLTPAADGLRAQPFSRHTPTQYLASTVVLDIHGHDIDAIRLSRS